MKSTFGAFRTFAVVCLALMGSMAVVAQTQEKHQEEPWRFAVSGDSRNCGDVMMPAIASGVLRHDVDFYWHLGDFRLMSGIDEDITHRYGSTLTLKDYRREAWGDFIAHQVAPFGLLPVYLGIGNHELYGKTEADVVAQFAYWLDTPELRRQRAADNPQSDSLTYYHWQKRHIDFINLDNAPEEGFSNAQLQWLEGVLAKDKEDPAIFTIVVGMHRALPNSLACGHSMNGDIGTPADVARASLTSGRRAYQDFWKWHRDTGKRVYILASHSHFFMERIFETPFWRDSGDAERGVLPGWIVGTAGAVRYALPEGLPKDIRAQTGVGGYLLGTVGADGEVKFEFQEVKQEDVPKLVYSEFKQDFVKQCFVENKNFRVHRPPESCMEK
jgi:Calcineurin-like phosphoesterase